MLTHYLVRAFMRMPTEPSRPDALSFKITGTSNTEISFEHGLSSSITMRTLDEVRTDADAVDNVNPATIRGSLDGVDGQYVCDGNVH